MDIQDSVAVVTGANRGIGLAFTWALLAHGAAKVYAGVRTPEDFYEPGVQTLRLDVTDADQVAAAAAAAADDHVAWAWRRQATDRPVCHPRGFAGSGRPTHPVRGPQKPRRAWTDGVHDTGVSAEHVVGPPHPRPGEPTAAHGRRRYYVSGQT